MSESVPGSAPAPAPGDKREHPRFKVEGATASVGQPGFLATLGFGPIQHTVINLSQGGAMIRLGKRVPVGSRHELRLEVPKCKDAIETVGEVRWCLASAKNEWDIYVGLRFLDLPATEKSKLADLHQRFTSAEHKAKSGAKKDASSIHFRP